MQQMLLAGSQNDESAAVPLTRGAGRTACLALATFAALAPFQAIAGWSAADWLRFPPCDWAVITGSPWLALAIWRARSHVIVSPVVRGWIVFALAGTISAFVNARSLTEFARVWSAPFLVASFVAIATLDSAALRRIVSAAIGGGGVALGIGLLGYACSVTELTPRIQGDLPFAFQGPHPIFDGVVRFAGTFGLSCQDMGDYLLVWIALVSASRWRIAGMTVGCVSVLATFASTWIGLPIVLLNAIGRFKARFSRTAILGTMTLGIVASWLINFGFPSAPAEPHARCAELDLYHYVTHIEDARRERCSQLEEHWPYQSRKGTYRHSKEVAWNAFLRAPIFGIGPGAFREAARADVEKRFGPKAAATYYTSPHCDILGVAAERGGIGLLALALLGYAVLRSRRGIERSDPLWAVAFALVVIGFNADLLHHRFAWMLTGLLAVPRESRL